MSKSSKILLGIWIVLAILSFVGAFFTMPLIVKILGFIFGGLNLMIIGSLLTSVIQGAIIQRKIRKLDKDGEV